MIVFQAVGPKYSDLLVLHFLEFIKGSAKHQNYSLMPPRSSLESLRRRLEPTLRATHSVAAIPSTSSAKVRKKIIKHSESEMRSRIANSPLLALLGPSNSVSSQIQPPSLRASLREEKISPEEENQNGQ